MFVRVAIRGQFWASLFFIIYINDIVADINSSIKLFEDDTVDAAETLNTDLAK
jgi:hypothetical protein